MTLMNQDTAIEELAQLLIGMSGTPMTLVPDPDRYRPVDIPVLRGDNTKLRTTTGWSPEYTLEATLADLLDECRQRVQSTPSPQPSRS
jgi:GDP-4-dehydro-6-deoxy-D-mannose reductase